jgi:hypothetical protein
LSQICSKRLYKIGFGIQAFVRAEGLILGFYHLESTIHKNWFSSFHIFFEEQMAVHKLSPQSFILTFCIMYFAGRCRKHWQCDVLRHHHFCGMWPCFTG